MNKNRRKKQRVEIKYVSEKKKKKKTVREQKAMHIFKFEVRDKKTFININFVA